MRHVINRPDDWPDDELRSGGAVEDWRHGGDGCGGGHRWSVEDPLKPKKNPLEPLNWR